MATITTTTTSVGGSVSNNANKNNTNMVTTTQITMTAEALPSLTTEGASTVSVPAALATETQTQPQQQDGERQETPVSFSTYKQIVEDFLTEAGFELPPYEQDASFDQEVIDVCLAQDLPAKRMEVIAKLGAAAAKWFYPKHPRPLQIALGKFTALAFTIDDLGHTFTEALHTYRTRLVTGQPMDAKIMRSLVAHAHEVASQYYDTWDADMIVKAVLEFFSANLVEIERGSKLKPTEDSPAFTSYFRLKSGVAEPFAYFIFPLLRSRHPGDCAHLPMIPDLMAFMDEVNDLMSFYKESMVGDERDNAIYMHASAKGQGLTQALLDYRTSALELVKRIRAFAASHEEAGIRNQVDEFLNGYMAFHLTYPRYRLRELDLAHARPYYAAA